MTYLEHLFPTEILQAIGWTLLHSLWQGMVIAVLLAILLFVWRKKSSQMRYALSVGALLFLLAAVFGTYFFEYQSIISFSANETISGIQSSHGEILSQTESIQTGGWFAVFLDYFNEHLPFLVMFWLVGILFLGLRMIGEITYVYHLKNYRTRPAPSTIQDQLSSLIQKMDIKRPVKILKSMKVKTPMVVGIFKPVILLPVSMITGLSHIQIESILAHELAHIKRHDFVINMVQSLVEVLLFFNPAVWWISTCIRAEREHCCDDLAIGLTGDKAIFAKTLAQLEEMRMSGDLALAFAGKRKGVLHRIRRILKKETTFYAFSRGFWGSLILIMCFLLAAFNVKKSETGNFDTPLPSVTEGIDNKESGNQYSELKNENVVQNLNKGQNQISNEAAVFETKSNLNIGLPKLPALTSKKLELSLNPIHEKFPVVSRNNWENPDTIPPDKKRELELIERRMSQITRSMEETSRAMEELETQTLEEFRRNMEMGKREIEKAAEQLAREHERMEREGVENFKRMREEQARELEMAARQLAEEQERLDKERAVDFEKTQAEQKAHLEERIRDLEAMKKDLDNLPKKQRAQREQEIQQKTMEIEHLKQEIDNHRAQFQNQMKMAQLNLEYQKQGLELKRRQIDLNSKQHQIEMEQRKEELNRARQEIEMARKEMAGHDLEKIKLELEEQKRKMAEEVEMLKMELKILKAEKQRRVE